VRERTTLTTLVRSLSLAFLALLALAAAPSVARAQEATLVTREVPLAAGRTLASTRAPERFDLVGLHWQGPGRVFFRTRSLSGRWSGWRVGAPEAEDAPDPGTAERARQGRWKLGNPYWTGPSNRLQYRLRGHVKRLRVHYVWSPVGDGPQRLPAAAAAPSVITRAGWRASESIRRDAPRYASSVRFAVVHHSAGSSSYSKAQAPAVVRAIQVYHVRGNGWDDIGYNFLVDRFGQVYEGRFGGVERNVIGAHAQGFNTGSVGVALLGHYDRARLTAAARSALVRLLAWRLDVAHVDPLQALSMPSGGNPRFPTGIPVLLRPISGHRDVGFTSCPGSIVYAQLNQLARAVSLTGLPKLFSPAATLTAGRVRFTGRLSAPIPWTISVRDGFGSQVATGGGFGARVDWTWDSRLVAPGRYQWTIAAGPTVRPATGSVLAGGGSALTLSAVSARPPTVSPNGDGVGDTTTIRYTLATPATVTATLLDGDGVALATLFSPPRPVGTHVFRWLADALPDGGYTVLISAKTFDGREVSSSVPVVVNRTLSFVSAKPSFLSPNADRRSDSVRVSFTLAAEADVSVTVRTRTTIVHTLLANRLPPGVHAVDWDGLVAGVPVADGTYETLVEAVTPLGTASQPGKLTVDTTVPVLRLVSAWRRLATLSEPATVTTVVDGVKRTFARRKAGLFRIPASSSYRRARVAAVDRAGNIARQLIVKRGPTRRTAARAGTAARRAIRAG
jgi:N-acetylmuramoyl-L-alanine amidase